MNIRRYVTLADLALFCSSAAVVAELSIIPTVKVLPEAASFWSLWILLATSIGCAFVGIIIGASRYRVERSRIALMGSVLGALALGLVAVYGFVQWLIYL